MLVMLCRAIALKKCCSYRGLQLAGWRLPACGSGQPHSRLGSLHVDQAGFMWFLPPAAPWRFRACFLSDGTAQRPTASWSSYGQVLLGQQSPFFLFIFFTLNAHMHSPLQNKWFGIKVQSCSNNRFNYLLRWEQKLNQQQLFRYGRYVPTAKVIFSPVLVFHEVTWPKDICTWDQMAQEKAST